MVKLLAVDLDGTLIRRDGEIDPRDLAALDAARAAGVVVTIATGRLLAGTRAVAEQLRIDVPIACADGAQLADPIAGTEIVHYGIVGSAATRLRTVLRARPVCSFVMYQDGVLYDRRGAPFRKYLSSWTPRLDEVGDLYEHEGWTSRRGLSGVVAIGADGDVAGAARQLARTGQLEVFDFPLTRSPTGGRLRDVRALLVHAGGVSKGAALAELAERFGCHRRDVVAIGDWHNDVSMFAAAGRSFVMAHAPERVREAATDRLAADARTGGGIAEALALLRG